MPHFESQRPNEFGWPTPPAGDFVAFHYGGHSFPQGVARGTDRVFRAALDLITAQPGFTLPGDLGFGGGCWGQSTRKKTSGNGWSFHAYGLAIDVAAPWNPYGSNRPAPGPHRLPENTAELVRPLGVLWGAQFDDWMHLEIHLTPDEVAQLSSSPTLPPFSPVQPRGFPLPLGHYYGPRTGPARSVSNLFNPNPDYVAGLQAAQRVLGCPDDGMYGPITRAATQLWQGEHGLAVDGLIGPDTWRSLFG
jgi:peptidoglycan hydrolase-like protein with peptidoglycan-binding domain